MILEKNRKWSIVSVALGILILIFLIPDYQKPSITTVVGIFLAVYLVLTGILRNKIPIISMIIGSALLICVFIWILIEELPLLSFGTILLFIASLGFIVGGILAYLGYIPEEWLN
ncbi:hypothetical protein DSECCO2_294450 [anaerobic digester metagenome]